MTAAGRELEVRTGSCAIASLTSVQLRAADPKPERVRVHHITLVPALGARVIVTARRSPIEAAASDDAHLSVSERGTRQVRRWRPSGRKVTR